MKSFEYAKTKKNKPKKKWYVIHGKKYSFYIWALPLVPFVMAYDKIAEWAYNRRVWNEQTARDILNRVLPYVLEWVEEDNAYYYCMDWGYSSIWRKAPFTKRKWAKKFDYKLHHFVKEGYEHPNYAKTIENDGYETWVKFEPLAEKFPFNV